MSKKQHHVVPNSDRGGWDVKRAGGERASGHFETKAEAVAFGREVSRSQGTEFIVHNRDGRISGSDSHGNDPCPPHDKR